MATEAKMGMCIIVILVCAFGFLVYNKFDLKQKAMQVAQTPPPAATPSDENPTPPGQTGQFAEFFPPAATQEATTPPASASRLPQTASIATTNTAAAAASDLHSDNAFAFHENREAASQFDLSEPAANSPSPVTESGFDNPFTTSEPVVASTPETFEAFGGFDESKSEEYVKLETLSAVEQPAVAQPALNTAAPESETADSAPAALDRAFTDTKSPSPSQPSTPTVFDEDPAFTNQPPASDIADAAPVPDPGFATERTLPPVEDAIFEPFAPSSTRAPATTLPTANAFADSDSDLLPTVDGKQVASAFEPAESVAMDPPFTDSFPVAPFPAFGKEPQLEPVIAQVLPEKASSRGPAPILEFPIADFEKQADTDNQNGEETLIALATPTPDDDFFDDGSISASADDKPFTDSEPSRLKDDFSPGTRTFNSDGPSIKPFAPETSVPILTPAPVKSAASARTFPKNETGPEFSIPVQRPDTSDEAEGIARFAAPKTVQQVSGTSTECEICEVRDKDNYWTISKRVYGTSRYFSSLALYNQKRIPDPKKLRPGMKVMIPHPEALEQKYPEFFPELQKQAKLPAGYFLKPDGTPAYRVGERETLSEISKKHLGRASRWSQIYRMNQQILKDPNKLKPGTVINLPDDATSVHLAP